MSQIKMGFARVPEHVWQLGHNVNKDRVEELLRGISFAEIVERIAVEAEVVSHARQVSCSSPRFYRFLVTLKVRPSTVTLFHSASSGYRAQFYHSIKNGELANQYALTELLPRIQTLLLGRLKQTCPWPWVVASLLDPSAKLWIHQGLWLRHATKHDRELFVARWVKKQSCPDDKKRRKKAFWSTLIPHDESRIDVKGGYRNLQGAVLGNFKPNRSQEIHELGFT